MHAALAQFAKTYDAAELPDDALAQLLKFGEAAFAPHAQQPSVRYFWWPRSEIIAAWVVEEEARRRTNGIVQIYAEINGSIDLAGPSGPVTVTARALIVWSAMRVYPLALSIIKRAWCHRQKWLKTGRAINYLLKR